MNNVSIIFEEEPARWGLRGDPYLWCDLKDAFVGIPLPCKKKKFIKEFKAFFESLTGHSFDTDEEIFGVEKYRHGGMSSGGISMKFWKKEAIPLLLERLSKFK